MDLDRHRWSGQRDGPRDGYFDHAHPDRPCQRWLVLSNRCRRQCGGDRNRHHGRTGNSLHAVRSARGSRWGSGQRAPGALLVGTGPHWRGHGDRLPDRTEDHRRGHVECGHRQHRIGIHHLQRAGTYRGYDLRLPGVGHQRRGNGAFVDQLVDHYSDHYDLDHYSDHYDLAGAAGALHYRPPADPGCRSNPDPRIPPTPLYVC